MEEKLDLHDPQNLPQQDCCNHDLVEIADGILFEARANIWNKPVINMPISQLSTLGAGVASLLPAFRTVTQTTVSNVEGYYHLIESQT